jgi:type II secretory pathway predicted ATPase ExeA
MKISVESQKAKMKEKINKIIDEHYEEFSKRSEHEEFKIDEMEELMLEQQEKIREALSESNGELVGSIETEVKKNALIAEGPCGERKKTKR